MGGSERPSPGWGTLKLAKRRGGKKKGKKGKKKGREPKASKNSKGDVQKRTWSVKMINTLINQKGKRKCGKKRESLKPMKKRAT